MTDQTLQTAPIFNKELYLQTWLYGIKRKDTIGLLIAMRRDAAAGGANKSYIMPMHVMVANWSQNVRVQMHMFRRGMGIAYHGMEPIRLQFTCILPHFQNLNGLYGFYEMLNNVFSDIGDGYTNYVFALNIDDITMMGYILSYTINADDVNVMRMNVDMIVSAFQVRGETFDRTVQRTVNGQTQSIKVITHPVLKQLAADPEEKGVVNPSETITPAADKPLNEQPPMVLPQ
jgi:hypothetical protein